MSEEKAVSDPIPRQHSLFRLIVDQARVDEDVRNHQYKGSGTEKDPYVVTFIPGDAGNPFNWTKGRRWMISMIVAVECFVTAFSSSAYSGAIRELLFHFRANITLLTGGISLFVLGFAVGPLVWAPLSEMYGRQYVFIGTFALASIFSAACTADNTIATLLIMRFFAGAFGSSPFTNAGGVIADVFPANERGLAMAFFALAPSMGPTFGPWIAGFLSENEGWRWVMGMTSIFTGLLWILGSLLVPETYAPVILSKRAKKLSQMDGKVYKTETEAERGEISAGQLWKIALLRPWVLLFKEPIVLILSIYMAIIYGTLYLLFGAYPVVFQIGRGWGEGIGGLPFLGVAVGMFAAIIYQGWSNKKYLKIAEEHGGVAPPEARLLGCMVGAVAIPIGMIWFAWTNQPSIHWMVPTAAGAPFGFGLTLIFLGVTSYLIDAYTIFAASVLAANAVLRSLFGAAFPLFTRDMYSNLGIHWASMVPAFLAIACLPAPFVLYKYGASIRARCVYASEAEAAMNKLRAAAGATGSGQDVDMLRDRAEDSSSGMSITSRDSNVDVDVNEAGDKFAALKVSRTRGRATTMGSLQRIKSKTGSIAEAAAYNVSPYDIDRVNTRNSVAGVDLNRVKTGRSTANV